MASNGWAGTAKETESLAQEASKCFVKFMQDELQSDFTKHERILALQTILQWPGPPREWTLEPGLQVLEIPAPASSQGQTTRIHLSADGRLLHETNLSLAASPPVTPADYVDVFKGTAHSRWMIAPGPWMPFSMVKLAPDNQTQGWIAGYEYSHEFIDCFSHIHEWTMGGLGMMPTLGPLRTQPGLDGAGYSSRFDKATERGGIGFYEVFLKDSGIRVELTATTRASLQRYTTRMLGSACMLNWIGAMPDAATVLAEPGGHWHDYGKSPREGRKVGHATLRADSQLELADALERVGVELSREAQVAPVIARLRSRPSNG